MLAHDSAFWRHHLTRLPGLVSVENSRKGRSPIEAKCLCCLSWQSWVNQPVRREAADFRVAQIAKGNIARDSCNWLRAVKEVTLILGNIDRLEQMVL